MTATLVVFASTRLIVLLFVRPNFMAPLHQTVLPTATGRRADDWVLSDTLVDAGGGQVSAAREDLAILHAQQANIDPAHLPGHARLEADHLLPAGRSLLDVPGLRGRPVHRPVDGDRGAGALARAPDAGLMTRDRPRPPAAARRRRGGGRDDSPAAQGAALPVPAAAPGLALRVRQPRADEPVLRPGQVRQRGCGRAARCADRVDRLGRAATSARWCRRWSGRSRSA